ncbi:lipolytic enzyme [Mycena olivaceomarginata]|nr:lipolytic enzyme [Mycena olivaceomarginata]
MLFKHSLLVVGLTLFPSSYAGFSGKNLKIMPLGASLTYGTASSDLNGYRATLDLLLAGDGNTVDMVGSQKSGNFTDPDHEGYPGFIISQIDAKGIAAMPVQQPNIVTLAAGTNDMLQNVAPADAPARLVTAIQDIWMRLQRRSSYPVILVDAHAVVAVGDLADGTHPNDAGYKRIAKVFYDGIQERFSKGWIFDF